MAVEKKKDGIRLAHLMAQRGLCSRRKGEEWILEGKVTVNGKYIVDPATNVNPEKDEIKVDGKPLPHEPEKHIYIALNKPKGYLSSFIKKDESGKTLTELINIDKRLFTVGRLDLNTDGLLLVTSDGDWANRVIHPRYEKEKEYVIWVKSIKPKVAVKLLSQAEYKENKRLFKAKKVFQNGNAIHVVLTEGRNRQVRRLAKVAGLEIKELVRVRIGPVSIGRLHPGGWRKLTESEIAALGK